MALSARAHAETPASATPAPAAAATAPDLVRLKNGGMLRGTIAESEPGQSVTIVLLTGETRKISAADLRYAGPANAAPPAPAQTAPAPPTAAPADAKGNGNGNPQSFAGVNAAEARIDFVSALQPTSVVTRAPQATAQSGPVAN
jgi:hypothetical protein